MTDHYKSRASTHADGCWDWGPKHYECELIAEVARIWVDAGADEEAVRKMFGGGDVR